MFPSNRLSPVFFSAGLLMVLAAGTASAASTTSTTTTASTSAGAAPTTSSTVTYTCTSTGESVKVRYVSVDNKPVSATVSYRLRRHKLPYVVNKSQEPLADSILSYSDGKYTWGIGNPKYSNPPPGIFTKGNLIQTKYCDPKK